MHFRSGGSDPGRDGCRVPLPWRGDGTSFGFSPPGATASPWLPQPVWWGTHAAHAQDGVGSMLSLYREALQIRRSERGLGDGSLRWLDAPSGVLAFARGERFACVLNLSAAAIELPPHDAILLASGPLEGGLLPPDTAVWLRAA